MRRTTKAANDRPGRPPSRQVVSQAAGRMDTDAIAFAFGVPLGVTIAPIVILVRQHTSLWSADVLRAGLRELAIVPFVMLAFRCVPIPAVEPLNANSSAQLLLRGD